MKNTYKLIGIIAIVAVIGVSMANCDNGGGGGGDTYTAVDFSFTNARFTSAFSGESAPAIEQLRILPGTRAELTAKVTAAAAMAAGDGREVNQNTGLSYSDVANGIQRFVDQNIISLPQKTQILNHLNSNGYGVCAVYIQTGVTGILAAYKE